MECQRFEATLVELMDRSPEGPQRDELLRVLRAHADRCASCAGTAELLQLLDRPVNERDFVDDPGEAYWASFDSRLRERIQESDATRGRRQGRRWRLVAAAALLAALAGLWAVRQPPAPEVVRSQPAPLSLPVPLVESLSEAPPAEVLDQLDVLADWESPWEGGDLFPDVSDLDAEAQQELLAWLREQSS